MRDSGLILLTGIGSFVVSYNIVTGHFINLDVIARYLLLVLQIGVFVALIRFIAIVYRIKYLIDAFAQQVTDEISRSDIDTPIMLARQNRDVQTQFMIDGLARLYAEQQGAFFGTGSQSNDAEIMAKVAEAITAYSDSKFKPFLYERGTLRWAIDGLEALIGDHRSVYVAWDKGTRYLARFMDEERRRSLPWFPSYMKILGLPHNHHRRNFSDRSTSLMSRSGPKNRVAIWCACHMFTYRQRLRIFNLRGEEAWRQVLRFKADTIDFGTLKSGMP